MAMMDQGLVEGFRLSPQQKQLWNLQRSDEKKGSYRARVVIIIEGPLDQIRLRDSIKKMIARHEILRTSFQYLPGMSIPLQVVMDSPKFVLLECDLSDREASEYAAWSETLWQEIEQLDHVNTPLSLLLARRGPENHALLLDLPALCADTITLKILVEELACLYGDQEVSDDPIQYIDLSEWQNGLLEDEETEAGRAFWRGQALHKAQDVRLPLERTVTNAPFVVDTITRPVPPELQDLVTTLAQEMAVSNDVVWLVGWHILLWRHTNQESSIIGATFDGREYEELKGAIGLLARQLPIGGRLDTADSFMNLINHMGQLVKETAKWQEYFTWEQAGPSIDCPYLPFAFDNAACTMTIQVADLTFTLTDIQSDFDRYNLKLTYHPSQLTWRYNPHCFTQETIHHLADAYLTLMSQALNQPHTLISRLDILGQSERQQILEGWNNSQTDFPTNQCFHDLFARQVEQTPNATAVIAGEQRLTYRQLNQRANQLAHYLQARGVGPDTGVGVYLDNAVELIIGLLGIFKAGGAYVPLDPSYPPARIAFTMQDARLSILLTQEHLRTRLPEPDNCMIICLDTEVTDQVLTDAPVSTTTAENIAYIIYTSGSTGTPKGVMVSHRSLVNYLFWVNKTLFIDAPYPIPLTVKTTFDASLKQLFAPLLAGRAVWVLPSDIVTHPNELWQAFTSYPQITFNCVPPLWRALLDTIEFSTDETLVRHISHLLVGGEALTQELVDRSRQLIPHLQIWNLYGPTEATANASASLISAEDRITIGHPVANTQLYILDSYQQPVPAGISGELYIGGTGVARGYLNHPALTAERFVPDPFSLKPGTRLYKTGDFARYLADGRIEFLGRVDHQVKIRGNRVELGEIETVLHQHAAVAHCALTVHEEAAGDKRLIAYVEYKQEPPPEQELKAFLKARLPVYMIPQAFIPLDAMPFTSGHKINRGALPSVDKLQFKREKNYVPPRNPLEEVLVGIWIQMLKVPQIGINDNFFDLGGDSILSIRTISALRSTFKMEMSIRMLFDSPTVAEFAQAMLAHQKKPGQVEKIANLLMQIEAMSDDEIKATLQEKEREHNKI
jgi:amino acid adenylation domain-containing protein